MPYKNPKDRDTYPAYAQKPAVIKKRAERNKARAMLMKEGLVHKGDGMDVDHKQPVDKGGKTVRSNLRVKPASANRTFDRTKNHSVK
jgi:hypothetical protein